MIDYYGQWEHNLPYELQSLYYSSPSGSQPKAHALRPDGSKHRGPAGCHMHSSTLRTYSRDQNQTTVIMTCEVTSSDVGVACDLSALTDQSLVARETHLSTLHQVPWLYSQDHTRSQRYQVCRFPGSGCSTNSDGALHQRLRHPCHVPQNNNLKNLELDWITTDVFHCGRDSQT